MAAYNNIKMENGIQDDEYTGDISVDNLAGTVEYFEYEDNIGTNYENESLIEYVEEDDDQNSDYVEKETLEDQLKTHTLSIKHMQIDGQPQEIYRCLECATDFVTLEDFTKVHKEMQKKLTNKALTNVSINVQQQNEQINDEQTIQNSGDSWMIIKEEQIIADENEAEAFEDFIETSENLIDDTNFDKENEDADTDMLLQVKEEKQSITDEEDDGEKYFCCDCQLVFSDIESAEQHVCSAINTSTATPEDSDKGADHEEYENNLQLYLEEQQKSLHTTKKNESTEVQYHCAECDKRFNSLQGLQIHNRIHKTKEIKTPDDPLDVIELKKPTCPICNTIFSSYKNLKLHMKIHDAQQLRTIEQALPAGAKTQYKDMNKFFCEICNKSFEQNLLGIHKNMHQQSAEYNCGICNRHFENKTSYDMHMQMHADKPVKPRKQQIKQSVVNGVDKPGGRFACQYCGRTFQRPFEKVRHERVHTGEKPHACEVCGKTFRVSYSLTLHLRTHTDIRPYVCATCNKRFKSQPVYAHHLRTHEAERAYKCETCSKSFRTSVQLSAHRNIHSKPYNCPVCNRPFASLYSVKIHMKTHNKLNRAGDTTKYCCYVCGAEYARVSALRIHMKDLHLIDFDTNQSLELDDMISAEDQTSQSQHDTDGNEDEQEVDHEAAVLIAAAAEADCAAYIEAATADPTTAETEGLTLHSPINPTYEVTLQNEELIVDNYQTEEIVTDWLSK
ncbi:zinc finger protein 814 [Zeugodacus cucurbitae]|uniref:Zinc finger protein 227 n=2 Tax=Zeugodacus cucurbitae TaxID=28588 RepID=A0A0A1X2J1_ZEUCU|nr:zinc finger protein 814 [Zeugodacus cucurbitae]